MIGWQAPDMANVNPTTIGLGFVNLIREHTRRLKALRRISASDDGIWIHLPSPDQDPTAIRPIRLCYTPSTTS